MDDLYFENELRNRQRIKVIEGIEKYRVYFVSEDTMSDVTKQVYQDFDDILDFYYSRKFRTYEYHYEMIEKFRQQLTDNKFLEMYNNSEFSPEEIEYIKLVEISKTWRGYHDFNVSAKHAIVDILLRRIIIEQFGKDSLDVFIDIIENELPKTERFRATIDHYMQLFSDEPYGKNLQIELKRNIEEQTTNLFNQAINCGGYAFKIDTAIFPTNQGDFSKSISSILDKFPFVRLLGDKQLEDDEYLVIYRAKNGGHHFIRIDSDASVREKDGIGEPKIFEDWGNLQDAPEAIFAVKKEHKMFGYNLLDINERSSGLDFKESVSKAIRERKNSFYYHNHNFYLKRSKQDEIYITTDDGKIVAEVIVDEEDCLVEVAETAMGYVENLSGSITPIICDGKLVNYEQFKKKERQIEEGDGR